MTAQEQYAAALRVIDEQRALLAAGTAGPWRRNPDRWAPPQWEHDMAYLRVEAGEPHPSSGLGIRIFHTDGSRLNDPEDERHEGDVAKAVTAVNLLGPMLDLAEAVLRRHHISAGTEHCDWCWDGPKRGIVQPRGSWWPCPDARAVLDALGVSDR